ncbi:humanin-like protein [Perognathus longimembris pacificus]|nr:humanin-like protein [Perognathus longimembris pacificus]
MNESSKRGLNCLLHLIHEIDLSVKRQKLNNKTRRPYVA